MFINITYLRKNDEVIYKHNSKIFVMYLFAAHAESNHWKYFSINADFISPGCILTIVFTPYVSTIFWFNLIIKNIYVVKLQKIYCLSSIEVDALCQVYPISDIIPDYRSNRN